MDFLRQHVTFANLVASLALFVALGGSSYAAIADPHDGSEGTTPPQAIAQPTGSMVPAPSSQTGGEVPPADQLSPPTPEAAPDAQPSTLDQPEPIDAGEVPTAPAEPTNVEESPGPTSDGLGGGSTKLRGNGGREKQKQKDDKADGDHGGGPPPWAPAHGYRCREAGNRPGSDAFKSCVHGGRRGR